MPGIPIKPIWFQATRSAIMMEKMEGDAGVDQLGHREYVGGLWDEMGKLQFDFMVSQGLSPEHTMLDIACGALRGGVHFIRYLDSGNYLGMDKEAQLIERGLEHELGLEKKEEKNPQFVISEKFEFSSFDKKPDYCLAQSLFSHFVPDDMRFCLRQLRAHVNPGCRFYVTFLQTRMKILKRNPLASHDHDAFYYTKAEMCALGPETGWEATYIGDWNHPRRQKMMQYVAV